MGTFTLASGLGLLFTGIIVMAVIGLTGVWIVNKFKDED
tara:strand:+ start:138 stop:254 length:117 start_codon:yes stop_codon:yes gene_type:complete